MGAKPSSEFAGALRRYRTLLVIRQFSQIPRIPCTGNVYLAQEFHAGRVGLLSPDPSNPVRRSDPFGPHQLDTPARIFLQLRRFLSLSLAFASASAFSLDLVVCSSIFPTYYDPAVDGVTPFHPLHPSTIFNAESLSVIFGQISPSSL